MPRSPVSCSRRVPSCFASSLRLARLLALTAALIGAGCGAPNTAPVPSALQEFVVTAGQLRVQRLAATDPQGDPLTWRARGALPPGMALTADGTLSWRPGAWQAGRYPVELEVCDRRGSCTVLRFVATALAPTPARGLERTLPIGLLDPFVVQKNLYFTSGVYRDFGLTCARFGAGGLWGGALRWDMVRSFSDPYVPTVTNTGELYNRPATSVIVTITPLNKADLAKCGTRDTTVARYPCDAAAYSQYVKDGVRASASTVTHFQVHNEPMNSGFWADTKTNYARLVQLTSSAVRASCPTCKVVLAGMTPSYLSGVLDSLAVVAGGNTAAAALYDAVDVHLFGLADMPANSGDQIAYQATDDQLSAIRSSLAAHGATGKSIWITETSTYDGTPSIPAGGSLPAQTEEMQARELVKRLVFPLSNGVAGVLWAQAQDDPSYGVADFGVNNRFQHSGLFTAAPVSAPKLSYWAMSRVAWFLRGVRWSQMTRGTPLGGSAQVRVISAPDAGGHAAAIVWWDWYREGGGDSTTVTLQMSAGVTRASVTTMVPARTSGAEVDPVTDFRSRVYDCDGSNRVSIRLGHNPVTVMPIVGVVSTPQRGISP